MNQDIKTLELARVYENQGHFKEAFEIYSFLDSEQTNDEVKAGLRRMEGKMEESTPDYDIKETIPKGKKISILLEKWLNLMILEQRLNNFKKIKARLL